MSYKGKHRSDATPLRPARIVAVMAKVTVQSVAVAAAVTAVSLGVILLGWVL